MSTHEYNAREALDLLMHKLNEQDEQLARQIQSAIDVGKDVEEKERFGRRKKPRVYRRTVRFSDEEALSVAIAALQACFVEQPLFVNSAEVDFRPTEMGGAASRSLAALDRVSRTLPFTDGGVTSEKKLEIELQTETQISREDQQTLRLEPVPDQLIEQQKENLTKLRLLATFGED